MNPFPLSRPLKRGEALPPPFPLSAFATLIIFLIAGAASAEEPAGKGGSGLPAGMVLNIEQAISMALRQNRDIANSEYSAESRRYTIDASKALFDLQLIPTGGASLNGGGPGDYDYYASGISLQKKMEYGTTVSIGPQVTRSTWQSGPYYTADMGITLTQPLLRGRGKEVTTDGIRTANTAYKTSLRNVYQTKVNIVLETVSAFYDAVRQKELLQLYEKMGLRLKDHARIAQAKEKVGVSTPMDTYRAEIPLKETEDAVITASEALQEAKDQLKLILALPQDLQIELAVSEAPDAPVSSLEDAIDTAMEKRVEIEQINQDIAEANRKASIMKHNIQPDLNLVFKYGRYAAADDFHQAAGLDRSRYSISLQVGSDVFRTAEKAAYEQSLIAVKTIRTDLENKRENIKWQVRKQWLSLREAAMRTDIRKAQIKKGDEKLALAELKFAHGMADNFDVIEAEKELQNARANLLDAEISYAIGTYNLKAILGNLVPRN
jgi:outer membrane protein